MNLNTRTVDGLALAYLETGSGEPVLLLHGYPESHHAWRHQLEPLARTRRVIAPDWFGWGASEKRLDVPYDLETEIGRLEQVLDAFELPAADLIGHDYGGVLALGLATRKPERVRRLAVLNSRAHGSFPGGWWLMNLSMELMARTPLVCGLLARFAPLHRLHRWMFSDACFDHERHLAWLKTLAGRRWLLRFYGAFRSSASASIRPRLGRIACPTALIWGTADPFVPVRIAEELRAGIPGATLTRIEGAKHFVMEERPDEVNQALLALLDRAVGSAPR